MKWYNTAFKYESNRDMAFEEMKNAGIRCDMFNMNGYYYISWCPFSKNLYQTAVQIVEKHLD